MMKGRTGLFMNLRVISKASGDNVAEKIPTCKNMITFHKLRCESSNLSMS